MPTVQLSMKEGKQHRYHQTTSSLKSSQKMKSEEGQELEKFDKAFAVDDDDY